jgi:cytochrome oxidase assembly protein ShyY1
MLIVALVCIAAGTWQIARFDQKVRENDALRRNAALPVAPVDRVLRKVGAPAPARYSLEFRPVRATGRYETAHQTLVRNRTVGGVTGFLVLTPLRTSDATLLVVRGFAGPLVAGHPPVPPAPPGGTVMITGRAAPGETRSDEFTSLANGQAESINPVDQAGRLGGPVYDGYVQLFAGQPGSGGLHGLPAPNLSNPAGGALEPQHFAYIIQWYLFAILALAAPFAMARAELRQQRKAHPVEQSEHAEAAEPVEASDEQRRTAKLADRYGRPR